SRIQIPNRPNSATQKQIMSYIKESYENVYKEESIDKEAAQQLTKNLAQVSSEQNLALTKPISAEEVSQVIDKLSNNKTSGLDGLTYEFFKDTKEIIVPKLAD
ncbi:6848_t:CDS:1, partial [Racocetra fulgida]